MPTALERGCGGGLREWKRFLLLEPREGLQSAEES